MKKLVRLSELFPGDLFCYDEYRNDDYWFAFCISNVSMKDDKGDSYQNITLFEYSNEQTGIYDWDVYYNDYEKVHLLSRLTKK